MTTQEVVRQGDRGPKANQTKAMAPEFFFQKSTFSETNLTFSTPWMGLGDHLVTTCVLEHPWGPM